jgi:D-alanyl-lipoteichoic acid acyltransferase DltB (MBOAT superfamily)
MFPQLVAGPIVRYSVVSDAIEMRTENSEDFYIGVKRFIYGLGKKVIIANNIAIAADKAFELCSGRDLSVSMAYVGVISYMLQLYFDFSGYSDMAIGLGRMFGFQFDENFNYPYISQSIAEYWRRWHISLGTWFKDYVMYPVMRTKSVDRLREFSKKKWGKKVSKIFPTIVGTAVVWLLEGIWHGANWTFVIFGIYHGCIIILYTIFRSRIKKFDDKYSLSEKKTIIALRIIRTMILVAVADVMFRADSLTDALYYYKVLLGAGTVDTQNYAGFYLWNYKYLLILGIVGCYPILPAIKRSNINKNAIAIGETVLLIGILLISISYLIRGTYNPFVYFNF